MLVFFFPREKQEVRYQVGKKMGQDVMNMLVTSPSCALMKAGVKLSVGRERDGDVEKRQIHTAWEHAG